ncbi:MAG TPA: PEP-CTERM sorting domain-containing protein, partial [Lacipirellulaceae bacterium]
LTIGPNGIASIDQNSFNLDGTSAGTVITVGSNAELNLNLGDYDNDSATNSFDATITLHSGGISVTTTDAEFVMNGVLNMDNTTGAAPTWSGEPLDIGNDLGALSADLNVTGKGNSDFTAAVDFNSDADVSVSAESSLRLRSSVNFDTVNGANNAEFTGAGTISFSGAVNVNEAATLNMVGGTVDLDGVDTVGDFINVDAPFTINAANMSSFGKVNVGGTNTLDINNSVGAGVLTVNLDDANDDWTLNAAGVMNLVNDNNAATLLAGSDINLNGTVNVTGDVRVTARVDIGAGSVNIGTAGQPLRLSGGDTTDTNTIAGATVAGAGQLGADTGHALHGFGTINSDILFEGGSNLRASGGTLTINGTILAVNLLGTADDTGVLNIVDPWFTSGAPSGNIGAVVLNGGVLQGGQITNDDSTGLQGHGTITSRVINNTQIVAANGGSLVMQTASNDNDWDGAANTGDLIAVSANLELRDTATFGFAGTVSADNGLEVFANGFALDFNPGSTLSLEEGARYRSTNSTVIGGTVTVGAGAASTIEVPTNFVLTFETGSTTTLTGNLRLVNNFINIEAGAAFSGSGAVVIPDESGIVADNLADIGVLLDMQGTFRPGGSEGIGRIDLLDYQSSDTSELFVELTGTALNRFDRLVAEGDVIVDGYLNIDIDPVSPGVPFVPVLGQTFNIITANSVTGEFDLADISGMPNGLTFHIEYLPNAVQLQVVSTPFFSADFDNDGDVDGTDLIIWRGAFDLNQLGDADGDNDTDGADLLIWQRQFGSTAGAGAGATASVPEPGTLVLLLLALLTATPNRRRTDAESYCQGRPHRRQLGRLVGNDNRSRHHVSGALAAARRERNDPHRRQLVEERRHNHRARRDSRGLAMRLW